MALPTPLQLQPYRWSNLFSLYQQTTIDWPHAIQRHLSSHWVLAMTTYMHHWYPNQAFKPTSWTRKVICSLREYAYSQWKERNSHIHGVDLKASQALCRKHAQQQITTAYHNKSSIPGDEQSFTFGIPLTVRLLQPTTLLYALLLQYQARQHQLANQLKQEQCNCGKITKYLIAWTTGWCPTVLKSSDSDSSHRSGF